MGKFKVGDRVRILRHRNSFGAELDNLQPGQEYTFDHVVSGVGNDMWFGMGLRESEYFVRSDDVELAPPTAEAVSGAIRTVTRREIVPGAYGRVSVQGMQRRSVGLTIEDAEAFDATELREAAHLFNQLAEVLEENAKEAA